MIERMLQIAAQRVPAGRWAVGVSGGADSVALLLLLMDRADLGLHVVHLDHQTREGESAKDAAFVRELVEYLRLPCTVAIRSDIEREIDVLPKNASSRYRKARFQLFSQVVKTEKLQGVLLAHHADDQAETVLIRVLRGAAPANLAGIRGDSVVGGLRINRPLLEVPAEQLRAFLRERGQDWREDSSNQSDVYQRNRVRHWLAERPGLRERLLDLERASRQLREGLESAAPKLDESFTIGAMNELPLPVGRHAAAGWLVSRGVPPEQVSSKTCDRLIEMCRDAASSARQHFPGGLLVCRRGGRIEVAAAP